MLLGTEHAVALVKEWAVGGERSLEFDRVNVYRLGDGKIVEIWSYDSDPYALIRSNAYREEGSPVLPLLALIHIIADKLNSRKRGF